MKRKLTAILLAIAILAAYVPAAVASETSMQLTVEEILNEYHQKAFEAQMQSETNSASTWTHRGDTGELLSQETVDILTDAGYEAYNVTADNYKTLEAELKTNFTDLGLDPNSSYIIVISGEGERTKSRWGSDVSMEDNDFGGYSTFTYKHNGTSYTMRYVTITNANVSNNELFKSEFYKLSDIKNLEKIKGIVGDYVVTVGGEKIIKELVENGEDFIPYANFVCTVMSLLVAGAENPLELQDPGTLTFRAGSAWTRSYIQVQNKTTGNWHTAQCSTYAVTEARFDAAYVYDSATNAPRAVGGILREDTVYSPYYNNSTQRKVRAVEGYLNGYALYDCTGDIDISLENEDIELPGMDSIVLFSLPESTVQLIPTIQRS